MEISAILVRIVDLRKPDNQLVSRSSRRSQPGGRIDAIVIVFSKASDVVPHDIPFQMVDGTGIGKRVVRWVQEFLNARLQNIKVGDETSERGSVTSGVPQGTVIAPLLFPFFINDLPNGINSKFRLFGDDCVIRREIKGRKDIDSRKKDLDTLSTWAKLNKIKINNSKSKAISFTKNAFRIPWNIK